MQAFCNTHSNFYREKTGSYDHSNSIYNCHNSRGIRLITRLRHGLSHLRSHKFKHDFQDTLNLLSSCGNDVESIEHIFSSSVLNLLMKDSFF